MSQSVEPLKAAMADTDMEIRTQQSEALIDSEILKELMVRSDTKGWLQTVTHVGAILLTGYGLYVLWGTWWAVPLLMLQGALISLTYAGQHECSHHTVFRTRWLNDLWGHVFGFLGFYPFYADRTLHMIHHQYTKIRGKDPEMMNTTIGSVDRPFTIGKYLYTMSAIPYWLGQFKSLVIHALGQPMGEEEQYYSPKELHVIFREARVFSALYCLVFAVSVYTQSWLVVELWLAPMFMMKWVHFLHGLSEHYGMPNVADTMNNARTVYSNPLYRWLNWNMNYHTAHHRFANVPFYNTKKLDRILRPRIRHKVPGYIALHAKFIKAAIKGERYGYEGLM